MTANIYIDLSKVMLDTERVELAEKYLQESIKLLSEFGESDDLAFGLIHLGKCFLARSDLEAARQTFRQVIKIGQTLSMFYFVYWGLVNIARIYSIENQTEKALRIALALRHYPIEFIRIKEEGDRLLADLQDELPQWQVEATMQQVDSQFSPDPVGANALAYALKRDME